MRVHLLPKKKEVGKAKGHVEIIQIYVRHCGVVHRVNGIKGDPEIGADRIHLDVRPIIVVVVVVTNY